MRHHNATSVFLTCWMIAIGSTACAGKPVVVNPVLPMAIPQFLSEDRARQVDLGDIIFDFFQSRLRIGAKEVLGRVTQVMKGDETRTLLVEGHADDLSSAEAHRELGLQRAKAVQAHLVNQGIEMSRITTVSYGDEHRLCTQPQESCRQQNRRVHLSLLIPQEGSP